MTFIRNIRQKLCKHYFVFAVNKTTADADGLARRYIRKAFKEYEKMDL